MARTDIRRDRSKSKGQRSELADTLIFLVKLVVFVALFRSFVLAPFSIPSQSMLPRLYIGDYLFVSKWNYGYSRYSLWPSVPLFSGRIFGRLPARGDVVGGDLRAHVPQHRVGEAHVGTDEGEHVVVRLAGPVGRDDSRRPGGARRL